MNNVRIAWMKMLTPAMALCTVSQQNLAAGALACTAMQTIGEILIEAFCACAEYFNESDPRQLLIKA